MKRAKVYMHDRLAGVLVENDEGYSFSYLNEYLDSANPEAISLTLPISQQAYTSATLFPFFDGLIPEGWLLEIANSFLSDNMKAKYKKLVAARSKRLF